MKEFSNNFKHASGQELGDEFSIEVVDFQDGQKLHSVHSLQPLQNAGVALQQLDLSYQPPMDAINPGTSFISSEQDNFSRFLPSLEPLQNDEVAMDVTNNGMTAVGEELIIKIPLEDILHCSNMSREDASRKLEVSMFTFKRNCRVHGIQWWPPRNIKTVRPTPPSRAEHQEGFPQPNSVLPSNQASASVNDMVTIRAKYVNDITIKFQLSLSSGLVELQQQVAKRLELDAESYYVKYKDEEGELILIACDDDLRVCIHTARSLGKTKIVVLLEPK